MTPSRGEVYWVELNPVTGSEIAKTRPCVVVGRDEVNRHRRTVIVVPLSSSSREAPPIHVGVTCGGRRAIAVIDQIRAVDKSRIRQKMAVLPEAEMAAISSALLRVLDLGSHS
jgi:mRNA interferase MazF